MLDKSHLIKSRGISAVLLVVASALIFIIAQVIEAWLEELELSSMYISFCAGFILFIPLVSLTLHPLLSTELKSSESTLSKLMLNVGLVLLVQGLFFLIWITDAIAIYSIYVDSNSFLAKAFNITSETTGNFSTEFFWVNLVLAWLFSLLSLVIGLLPCLVASVKNLGVVGNFVSAFQIAKRSKLKLLLYSFSLACSVVFTLLYANHLFLLVFPLSLLWVFIELTKIMIKN